MDRIRASIGVIRDVRKRGDDWEEGEEWTIGTPESEEIKLKVEN